MTFEEIASACRKFGGYEDRLSKIANIDILPLKKEYVKAARREQLKLSNTFVERIRLSAGKMDLTFSDWFEWALCANEGYNKHYSLLLKDLFENIDKYEKVFGLLEDEQSQRVFADICEWRFNRNCTLLVDAYSLSNNKQYLEPFERLNSKEVFVDCGGYIGDSSMDLISYAGGVQKIWLYEADEKNIKTAKKNLAGINTIFRNVGVSDKAGELHFNGLGLSSSGFTNAVDNDASCVKVVAIDEDIPFSERVTFIKMDIEGMELKALLGSEQHIKRCRPVLAICLYHNPQDIWELPLFIKDMTGESYKYYMRHYTMYHGETVFYAVPKEREINEE